MARAEPELDNYRAAMSWALADGGDERISQRLAASLLWQELARAEGRRYVELALSRVTGETPLPLVGRMHVAAAKVDSLFNLFKPALAAAE